MGKGEKKKGAEKPDENEKLDEKTGRKTIIAQFFFAPVFFLPSGFAIKFSPGSSVTHGASVLEGHQNRSRKCYSQF